MRISMLSRGSLSSGAVGSSNEVGGANRAMPASAEIVEFEQDRLVAAHVRRIVCYVKARWPSGSSC